ncbi:hypothetical protein LWE69_12560 [Paenibacillus sp. UKAQ_18]|nr:hypothetical protein [Paenibacillus sp. UKAQ_18]
MTEVIRVLESFIHDLEEGETEMSEFGNAFGPNELKELLELAKRGDPPHQEPYIGYRKGEPVRHKTRKLHEATFEKWSKSGKRIGVKHNYGYPFGVSIAVDYFDPRNIEKAEGEEE